MEALQKSVDDLKTLGEDEYHSIRARTPGSQRGFPGGLAHFRGFAPADHEGGR